MSKRAGSDDVGGEVDDGGKRSKIEKCEFEPCWGVELPSATETRLLELRALFPAGDGLPSRIPPVVLLHQLYAPPTPLLPKQIYTDIERLTTAGKIKVIRLGSNSGVIFTTDLKAFLSDIALNRRLEKSIEKLWHEVSSSEVDKSVLKSKYALLDKDISEYIRSGLLVINDEKSYAFSFPGLGDFMKALHSGRRAILGAIERSKYKELLVGEIERRPFKKHVKLGIGYQIADIIGANLVNIMETTSGTMLKHIPKTKKKK